MIVKFFFLPLILSLSFGLKAFAELQLDSPKKLITRASQGRIQLREVILDIQQNYPEMRDPVIFESYFYLLDDLKRLSIKFDLDEIYPKAVERLGARLAGHGIKWLSIAKHSTEKILYYQRWMEVEEATFYCEMMDFEIRNIQKDSEYRQAANNVDAIIKYFRARYPDRKDLHLVAHRIITEIANKFLKRDDVSEADVQYWLSKIAIASGFAEYIEYLQQNIYDVNQNNANQLHAYLRRLMIIQARYFDILQKPPYWLTNLMGDTALELASKMIYYEENFAETEFENILRLLSSRHLKSLAGLFTSTDHLPSQKYGATYIRVTQILIEALRLQNLDRESYDLSVFVSRISAALVAGYNQLEGTYLLKDERGNEWTFTMTQVSETAVYAAISDVSRKVFHTYLSLTYNVRTQEFIATNTSFLDMNLLSGIHMASFIQPMIRLKFDENSNLVFENLGSEENFRYLKGRKIESYPNYFLQAAPSVSPIEGEFKGQIIFPGGHAAEVTLLLTHMNGRTIGRLMDQNGLVFDITMSSTGASNVLYLSTGRLSEAAYAHIRLKSEGNLLRGYLITGGRGISATEFKLRKVRRSL